ncbi:repair protein PSO2 SNM1 [Coemansia sp. RSA 1804]|nr:repair protein PSO2 SNM1 [Coemansia sp. RSA 1804]
MWSDSKKRKQVAAERGETKGLPEEASVKVEECPVCDEELSHLKASQAEAHVNGCLDAAALEGKRMALAGRRKKPKTHTEDGVETRPVVSRDTSDTRHLCDADRVDAEAMLQEIEATDLAPEAATTSGYRYVYGSSWQKPQTSRAPDPRPIPAYKRIPSTSFTVDAFKYGQPESCSGVFLTHFHSDHYGGLTKTFGGHIYCSRITANCVTRVLGVRPSCVHALPMNTRCIVHGVYVTLLDAEHCPGAAIVLFEVPQQPGGRGVVRIVHTGDFRASDRQVRQISCVFGTDLHTPVTPQMIRHASDPNSAQYGRQPWVAPFADYVYLDTTYLDPQYTFPTQSQVVSTVAEFCRMIDADTKYLSGFLRQTSQRRPSSTPQLKHARITSWFQLKPGAQASERAQSHQPTAAKRCTLFVVGTYSIGKERLFIEIARAINARVYVAQKKRTIVDSIASPGLSSLITEDMLKAQVHAVPMAKVNMRGMAEYLADLRKRGASFSSLVAFSPTGWTHASVSSSSSSFAAAAAASPDVLPMRPSAAELDNACERGDIGLLASLFAASARLAANADDASSFGLCNLKPRGSSSDIAIFPVPYSEHSSFPELARFVCSLGIGSIVPTVFSSAAKNAQANRWLNHWQLLKTEFRRRTSSTAGFKPKDCTRAPGTCPTLLTFCPAPMVWRNAEPGGRTEALSTMKACNFW